MLNFIRIFSESEFIGKGYFRYVFSLYLKFFPIRYLERWLYLNPQDTGLASQLISNNYETYTNYVMNKMIKRNFVIVDIGSHVGDNMIHFSQLVGEFGKVYCFEPNLDNYLLLQKNISINKISNVIAINSAVSDNNGMVNLIISHNDTTNHRISKAGIYGNSVVRIRSDSLDNLLYNRDKIDLIKIDVQGWEIKCVLGMKKIIDQNSPTLIIEYWPKGLKDSGFEPQELLTVLHRKKYKIYVLDEVKMVTSFIKSISELNKYIENVSFVNLLCSK